MKKLFPVFLGIFLSLLIAASGVVAQDAVKTVNGGVLNGKAVSLPKPEYPAEAKKDNAEGSISVAITIDEEGNVTSATTSEFLVNMKVDETGTAGTADAKPAHPALREAAEKAAMGAKFVPTQFNGQPVKVRGVIIYNFVASHSTDGVAMKGINGGVLNGKATSLPAPRYPPAAAAVNASGMVNVQVTIDEDGNVISAEAVSGHPLLRGAAVEAAQQAKFSPTLLSGQPVKITGVITYNFVGSKPDNQ